MSLPARLDDDRSLSVQQSSGLSRRQLREAQRAQASSSLEVFRYGLGAHARAEIDRIDSETVADAHRAAAKEELDFVDDYLERVGQSKLKSELVARHVKRLSDINDQRLTQRFGGYQSWQH